MVTFFKCWVLLYFIFMAILIEDERRNCGSSYGMIVAHFVNVIVMLVTLSIL